MSTPTPTLKSSLLRQVELSPLAPQGPGGGESSQVLPWVARLHCSPDNSDGFARQHSLRSVALEEASRSMAGHFADDVTREVKFFSPSLLRVTLDTEGESSCALTLAGMRFDGPDFSIDRESAPVVHAVPLGPWPGPTYDGGKPPQGAVAIPPLGLTLGEVPLKLTPGRALARALLPIGQIGQGLGGQEPNGLVLSPEAATVRVAVTLPLRTAAMTLPVAVGPEAGGTWRARVDRARMTEEEISELDVWWDTIVRALRPLEGNVASERPTWLWASLRRGVAPDIWWPVSWVRDQLTRSGSAIHVGSEAADLQLLEGEAGIPLLVQALEITSEAKGLEVKFRAGADFESRSKGDLPHVLECTYGRTTAQQVVSESETVSIVPANGRRAVLRYSSRELASRVRSWWGIKEPAPFDRAKSKPAGEVQPEEPPATSTLSVFTPLDRGWLQFPIDNLPVEDPVRDASWFAREDDQASVLTGSWSVSASSSRTEPAPLVPWSCTMQRCAGHAVIVKLAAAGSDWEIASIDAKFFDPQLLLNGLLWLATDRPGRSEALPTTRNGATDFADVPLTLSASVDAPGPVWLEIEGPLKIAGKGEDFIQVEAKFGIFADATSKLPVSAWLRHPRMPLVAEMPMTRAAVGSTLPLESGQLAPFVLMPTERDKETSRYGSLDLRVDAQGYWPTLNVAAGQLKRSNSWPWARPAGAALDPEESQALELAVGLAFASITVPGLELQPSKHGGWEVPEASLRWCLPPLDALFALSQLPPSEGGGGASGLPLDPEPDARDDKSLRTHWTLQGGKRQLTVVQDSIAVPLGSLTRDAVAVTTLLHPLTWTIRFEVDATRPLGALTLGPHAGANGNQILAGHSGELFVSGRVLRLASAGEVPQVSVRGWAPSSWHDRTTWRDNRGLGWGMGEETNGDTLRVRLLSVAPDAPLDGAGPHAQVSTRKPILLHLPHTASGTWRFEMSCVPARRDGAGWVFDATLAKSVLGEGYLDIDFSAWEPGHAPFEGFEWRLACGEEGAQFTGASLDRRLPMFGLACEPLRVLEVHAGQGVVRKLSILARVSLAADGPTQGTGNLVILAFVPDDDGSGNRLRLDGVSPFSLPSAGGQPLPDDKGKVLSWPVLIERPWATSSALPLTGRLEASLSLTVTSGAQLKSPRLRTTLLGTDCRFDFADCTLSADQEALTLSSTNSGADAATSSHLRFQAAQFVIVPGKRGRLALDCELQLREAPDAQGQAQVVQFLWTFNGTSTPAVSQLNWLGARPINVEPLVDHDNGTILFLPLVPAGPIEPLIGVPINTEREQKPGAIAVAFERRAVASGDAGLPRLDVAGAYAEMLVRGTGPRWTKAHHLFTQGGLHAKSSLDLWGSFEMDSALSWVDGEAARDAKQWFHRLRFQLERQRLPLSLVDVETRALARKWRFPALVEHAFSGASNFSMTVLQVIELMDADTWRDGIGSEDPGADPMAATLLATYRKKPKGGFEVDMPHPGLGRRRHALHGSEGKRFATWLKSQPADQGLRGLTVTGVGMAFAVINEQPAAAAIEGNSAVVAGGDAYAAGVHRLIELPTLAVLEGSGPMPQWATRGSIPQSRIAREQFHRFDAQSMELARNKEPDLAIRFQPADGSALSELLLKSLRASGDAAPSLELPVVVIQELVTDLAEGSTTFWPRSASSLVSILARNPSLSPNTRSLLPVSSSGGRAGASTHIVVDANDGVAMALRDRTLHAVVDELIGFEAGSLSSTVAGSGTRARSPVTSEMRRTARREGTVPAAHVRDRMFTLLRQPGMVMIRQVELTASGEPLSLKFTQHPVILPALQQFVPRAALRDKDALVCAGPQRGWSSVSSGDLPAWRDGPVAGRHMAIRDDAATEGVPASGVAGVSRDLGLPRTTRQSAIENVDVVWLSTSRTPAYMSPPDLGVAGRTPAWLSTRRTRQRLPTVVPLHELPPVDIGTLQGDRAFQSFLPGVVSTANLASRAGVMYAERFSLLAALPGATRFDPEHPKFGKAAETSDSQLLHHRTPRPSSLPPNRGTSAGDRRLEASPGRFEANCRMLVGPSDVLRSMREDWDATRRDPEGVAKGCSWAAWFTVTTPTDGTLLPSNWDGVILLTVQVDRQDAKDTRTPEAFIRELVLGVDPTAEARASLVLKGATFPSLGVPDLKVGTGWTVMQEPGDGSVRRQQVSATLSVRFVSEDSSASESKAVRAALGDAGNDWTPELVLRVGEPIAGPQLRPPQWLRFPLSVDKAGERRPGLARGTIFFVDPEYERVLATPSVRSTPVAIGGSSDAQAVILADRDGVGPKDDLSLMVDVEKLDRSSFKPAAPDDQHEYGALATLKSATLLDVTAQLVTPGKALRALTWLSSTGVSATSLKVRLGQPVTRGLADFGDAAGKRIELVPGDMIILYAEAQLNGQWGGSGSLVPVSLSGTRRPSLAVQVLEQAPSEPPAAFYAALQKPPNEESLSVPLSATAPRPDRLEARDLRGDLRRGLVRRSATFRWLMTGPASWFNTSVNVESTTLFIVKMERSGQAFFPESWDHFAKPETLAPPGTFNEEQP